MRSSRSAAILIAVVTAGACGSTADPPDPVCAQSALTYASFGEAFFLDWCRSCHSAGVPGGMRQDAPIEINFDTVDDIRTWRTDILRVLGEPQTMPPVGGPAPAERDLALEWRTGGAP